MEAAGPLQLCAARMLAVKQLYTVSANSTWNMIQRHSYWLMHKMLLILLIEKQLYKIFYTCVRLLVVSSLIPIVTMLACSLEVKPSTPLKAPPRVTLWQCSGCDSSHSANGLYQLYKADLVRGWFHHLQFSRRATSMVECPRRHWSSVWILSKPFQIMAFSEDRTSWPHTAAVPRNRHLYHS